MSSYVKHKQTKIEIEQNPCTAYIYELSTTTSNKTVIYIHGGGFMYGTHNDLNDKFIQNFLDNNIELIGIDYPLSPENTLAYQINSLKKFILKLITELKEQGKSEIYLFGRSAGAYLALKIANDLLKENNINFAGLILFYGFYQLDSQLLNFNDKYSKLTPIKKEMINKILTNSSLSNEANPQRFMIYAYARQQRKWFEMLSLEKNDLLDFSLSEDQLKKLPKSFITASTTDDEVPFRVSKTLSKTIPNSTFIPMYNLNHNFDDTNPEQADEIYQKLIEWIN